MGSMKVWDGTAWQTASAGPSLPPVTSVDGRTGAVSLSDLYMSTAGNWTAYIPIFGTISNPTGSGMTPGTGGYVWAAYRMIAPYTMAIRMRFGWGSTGGNGGSGQIGFSLPVGYSTPADYYQYGAGWLYHSNGGVYAGLGEIAPNGTMVYMRATESTTSQLRAVDTGASFPSGWYPNGACGYFAVLNTVQRL